MRSGGPGPGGLERRVRGRQRGLAAQPTLLSPCAEENSFPARGPPGLREESVGILLTRFLDLALGWAGLPEHRFGLTVDQGAGGQPGWPRIASHLSGCPYSHRIRNEEKEV